MKIIFTDPHIEEKALDELEEIFKEIFKYNADTLIMCGDYYDKKKPTAKEVIFGTKWAYFFKKKFKKVIFLRGNHDRTQDVSAIDYLQYIGIEVVDEYVDENNNYYGHFMTNKSLYEYGTYQKTVEELSKYQFVILGHQHSYQKLSNNCIHLGSIRYVNFNESQDDGKYIMYPFSHLGGQRMKLESPIVMKDVKSVKDLSNINEKTKVRLILSSYNQFKTEINEIAKWKNKFVEFKIHLNFKTITQNIEQSAQNNEQQKLEEILYKGIEQIEDVEVRTLIKEALK